MDSISRFNIYNDDSPRTPPPSIASRHNSCLLEPATSGLGTDSEPCAPFIFTGSGRGEESCEYGQCEIPLDDINTETRSMVVKNALRAVESLEDDLLLSLGTPLNALSNVPDE